MTSESAEPDVAIDRIAATDLSRLLAPRTVAIVGASDDPTKPTGRVFLRSRRRFDALGATIYPVSTSRDVVDGLKAYKTLDEIPGEIDVAILFVGQVIPAMEEVIERGVGFAIAFSGGFAEVGEEGAELQRELEALMQRGRTRLLGPNTTMVLYDQLRDADRPGKRIAAVAQSGAQGQFLMQGQGLGLPIGPWVATGNEADLEIAEFIGHLAGQDDVGAIAVYAEGFRNGRRLLRAADTALEQGTPVVMVKVGRTEEGARAAVSHTGHLAGSDVVVDAALRQHGVIRVDELDELLEVSALLRTAKVPSGNGVAVLGTSGGSCAHMADLLRSAGVPLPELAAETQATLRRWIPGFLSVRNPVDLGAAILSGHTEDILAAIAADPGIDAVVLPVTQARNALEQPDLPGEKMGADAAAVAARSATPICVAWVSYAADEPSYQKVVDSPAHLFRSFRTCVTGVSAYLRWHETRARRLAEEPARTGERSEVAEQARALVADGPLSEAAALELLALYGIPVPAHGVVRSADEARALADELGGRVVAKIASADIPHKSDLGLVELGLEGGEAAAQAYTRLTERAAAAAPGAVLDGMLIAQHAPPGVEVVVGVVDDATFGPVVMAGLGGVLVEVIGDVAFRVPPFGPDEARRMLDELRGGALLRGHRGSPPADVDALVEVLQAVGRLAVDLDGLLAELDVNPVIAGPDGAMAVDALLRVRER